MADITYIPIRQLYPHPDNPRKELGDLSELAASIEENGVYQNLTVIPGHYLNSREYINFMAESENKNELLFREVIHFQIQKGASHGEEQE